MKPETVHYRTPEEQFQDPEKLELEGEQYNIVDIKPDITKSEVPVWVNPGWAVSPKTFKENILSLAESGRRTMSVDAPHGIDPSEVLGEQVPEAQLRKALAILEVLEQKDVEKIDVVAHSEGAMNIAIAACLKPEKFRNLVMINPAGMVGKRTFWGLARDFASEILSQQINSLKKAKINKQEIQSVVDAIRAVAKSPHKSYKEVEAMGEFQIHELLKILKKVGLHVTVIHSVDDKVFPMDQVQQTIQPFEDKNNPSRSGKYKEMVDGFISIKGSHNKIFLEPRKYTQAAIHALEAMEKLH